MATFHFVEDYEALVARLMREHPLDEAMALAVGGLYETIGAIEADILGHAGLAEGRALLDLGCGSGRLAHALSQRVAIDYLGLDVVQPLLDYAASKSAPGYRFVLNRALTLPAPAAAFDFAAAFSVFTHLLHAESFLYLEEMRRVLRPGGRIVFSFLEFAEASHWPIFRDTATAQLHSALPHLNSFIERGAIEIWAKRLDLRIVEFVDATAPRWSGHALGQSLAMLEKPAG